MPTQAPETADPGAKLRHAFALHQRGELQGAERLYREALALMPRHAGALHMLGLVQYQQGRHRTAAELIRASIAIDPAQPAAHSNLALALLELQELTAALAS